MIFYLSRALTCGRRGLVGWASIKAAPLRHIALKVSQEDLLTYANENYREKI